MKRLSENTMSDAGGRPPGIRAWSKCEYHLLKLLTSGPLLPTKKQICQPGLRGSFSTSAMRNAVNRLRTEGWLQRYSIQIHAPRPPKRPLLVCKSGQACPNFRELKAELKRRHGQTSAWQSVRVYLPSRQAANLFGTTYFGIGTADTHAYRFAMGQVVALLAAQNSRISTGWIWDTQRNLQSHERTLGIFQETNDGATRAVGLIRAQSCKSLERLHAQSSERGWSIELW